MQTLGVVKETAPNETRVALVPEVVAQMEKEKAWQVFVEKGAGLSAGFADEDYQKAGAKVVDSLDHLLNQAQYILAVNGQRFTDSENLSDKVLMALFEPYFNAPAMKRLKAQRATVLAMELVPRISRAQSMDVLSSQANVAGYAAVLLAAGKLPKVIPLMMTAAGTIKPAKFLILGAGVAGLQAIATAKRLGALVHAYDVRSVVKEQIESLGAKFVEIRLGEEGEGGGGYAKALTEASQQELREKLAHFAKDMDVIITTAQIPGRKAPLLLDEKIFSLMKRDSIIVDMAALTGGNVAGTELGEWVDKDGVMAYGAGHLACMMPRDASFTLSKNFKAMLDLIRETSLNLEDEILKDSVVCREDKWINQAYQKFVEEN